MSGPFMFENYKKATEKLSLSITKQFMIIIQVNKFYGD